MQLPLDVTFVTREQLKKVRAEGVTMVAEDAASSAWNFQDRRERNTLRRRTRARSTPLQRAMDPAGVKAMHGLLLVPPVGTRSNRLDSLSRIRPATGELDEESGSSKRLKLEHARRKENYKVLLERALKTPLQVCTNAPPSAKLVEPEKRTSHGSNKQGEQTAAESREHVQYDSETSAKSNVDGSCLTPEMLSHLGPLPDVTELDLCVEGLASASLLRTCTSLKSLSLNVNRFSSPKDLQSSTTLVRLGLRQVDEAKRVSIFDFVGDYLRQRSCPC